MRGAAVAKPAARRLTDLTAVAVLEVRLNIVAEDETRERGDNGGEDKR